MDPFRSKRLESLVREVLCELLLGEEIRDHRVANAEGLITVTDVRSSKDMRNIKVYISVTGGPEGEGAQVIEGLVSAKGYIKAQISPYLRMKFMPELAFFLDDSLARGQEVLATIERVTRGATTEAGQADS